MIQIIDGGSRIGASSGFTKEAPTISKSVAATMSREVQDLTTEVVEHLRDANQLRE